MARAAVPCEVVLVDDGSRDRSWEKMLALAGRDPRFALVRLSRNFGHQIAITAGLDHARGEAVVVMDADLQDPPEVVLEMLARWRAGADVVYGRRSARGGETWFKKTSAAAFYRLIGSLAQVEIPADTGDFRLMSRRAVTALQRLGERNRFVRGMVAWLGFKQEEVVYQRDARAAGETKYPLAKMIRFATDGLLSFSYAPLRLATWIGFTAAGLSLCYVLYAVLAWAFGWGVVRGWTSLVVAVLFVGGVQLLSLGIIGEYIGRIYDEVKGRPLYFTQEVREARLPETAPAGGDGGGR
jgi:dolichol-phosphate mannosyltransferase